MDSNKLKISDFVKEGNMSQFDHYREGYLHYITTSSKEEGLYIFPIPIEDTKGATFKWVHKSLELMRWIRKAIEDNTLQKQ